MEKICRLCRKEEIDFPESIFSSRNGQTISDIIMKVCPISEIYVNDGLPNKICECCLEILESAYELQKVSISSDIYYRQQMMETDFFVKEEKSENTSKVKIEKFPSDDEESFNFEQDSEMFDAENLLLTNQIDCSEINRSVKMTRDGTVKTLFNPRPVPGSSKTAHVDKYYACNFCDAKLKPRNNMIRHMLRHDPIKRPYACTFCLQRFDTEKRKDDHEYNLHMNETTTNIIVCEICGATGDHRKGMDDHMIDDHKQAKSLSEDVPMSVDKNETQGSFTRRRDDRFHPRPLPGQDTLKYEDIWYGCNFCDKQLKPRKNILRHIKLKHDPETLPFGCTICVERFKTADILKRHEREKHDEEVKEEALILFCDICSASGNSFEGMENHKMDDHSFRSFQKPISESKNLQPKLPETVPRIRGDDLYHPRPLPGQELLKYEEIFYTCNFCDKQMKPRKTMMRHMRMKHHPRNVPFACHFCIDRFDDESKLKSHIKSFHKRNTKSRVLFCDLCGSTGDNKEGMETHMIDDHSVKVLNEGEKDEKVVKTFPCSQCDLNFDTKKNLETHRFHHHEENRQCSKCNDMFRNRKDLRDHILMVHDKLFRILELHEVRHEIKCCACEKTFDSEHVLLKHLNVHSSNFKTVKCAHNMKPLVTFNMFYKHVRHQAKPKTHQCLKCTKNFPLDARFIDHLNSHKRRYTRKKLKCDKCEGLFRTRNELDIHDKVKHQKETLFICKFLGVNN